MGDAASTNQLVHLVGSVPLASAAEVFRATSEVLGAHLPRIPDGETGERTSWVRFQVALLRANPLIEQKPAEGAGSTGYQPPMFQLRAGADPAELEFPRLGYADSALASYATFAELKAAGVIRPETRFQVSLPTPRGPLTLYVSPRDIEAMLPAYRAALMRELAEVCAAVPHTELAVQWDVAPEIGLLEGVFPAPFEGDPQTVLARALVALGDAVPESVPMGYHLCYGDFGHQHFVEPRDTAVLVGLANRVAAGLSRPLNWVHLPVPRDRDDADYFAPLEDLRLAPDTELYLGLVHSTDGLAGSRRRLAAASKFRTEFGIGTECGFGRRDPATIPALLELHRDLIETR
ncbi:MAG: hypothetical protein QOG57_3518 [Pseudonocardiales bacterium]|nr:hypothetical protein [Pseudonocardiales bacterium]